MFYHFVLFIITLLAINIYSIERHVTGKNKYNNKPETIKLSRVWLL